MSTAIGIGCLALPYSIKTAGIAVGAVLVLIGGLVATWSINAIMAAAFRLNKPGYTQLIQEALGPVM